MEDASSIEPKWIQMMLIDLKILKCDAWLFIYLYTPKNAFGNMFGALKINVEIFFK